MTSYQIKTIRGKPFSVERYYMLSEIEQQSLLPVYLDEYPDDNDDQAAIRNRERSESNSTQQTVETEDSGELYRHIQLPEFAILYLLWDLGGGLGSTTHTWAAETYATKILKPTLEKYKSLAQKVHRAKSGSNNSTATVQENDESFPLHIYVVIDVLFWQVDDDSNIGQKVAHHLTQTILNDSSIIQSMDGVTVGYANHVRAAPGLEACLDSIMLGTKDRRRFGSELKGSHKSCVGLICHSLQDLVGYDAETETDAVQGVDQELNHGVLLKRDGQQQPLHDDDVDDFQPPIGIYARDAHKHWRVHKANLTPEPTLEELEAQQEKRSETNNLWIYALLAVAAAYYYNQTEIHGCYQFYKKILTMAWHHSTEYAGKDHEHTVEAEYPPYR